MDFFSWMMHPAMLAAGAAAVSLPIIIHLLNRRRFRTVEWAAMDFLLEADRKNRRRVQLENLLLLLLRCLAVLLLGLLLARPLMPGMLAGLLQQKQKIERVVLLDDSFSQLAPRNEVTGFAAAQQSLEQLLEQSATAADTDNWLTLFLTSRPEQPLFAWEPVTVATLPQLIDQVRGLKCSQSTANYPSSLAELNRYLAGQREGVGRAVYLYSDLRLRDWAPPGGGADSLSLQESLKELERLSNRRFVVDTGSSDFGNLAVTDVRCSDLMVANRSLRIEVEVANFGSRAIEDVPVRLEIDGGNPLSDSIASLGPGERQTVTFQHLFLPDQQDASQLAADPEKAGLVGPSGIRNHRLVARIERTALGPDSLRKDVLELDSQRGMALRLLDGIPVLLVDGDSSPLPERSETHYLKSLNVFGTGLQTTVISPADLETSSLAEYRVLFLCNVDELSGDRVKQLEQWVREGGAVVFMPGNQVRAAVFNETFFRDGAGLSPVGLDRIEGDPAQTTWVSFEPDAQVHPALSTIVNSDATGLTRVDVFSWWTTLPIPPALTASTLTAIRLNDAANSPAMLDRSLGRGRVIFFNVPADGDWTMWPAVTGSWVPVMLDLVDYLAGSTSPSAELTVGEAIRWPVDLTLYEARVGLRNPAQEKSETVATMAKDGKEPGNSADPELDSSSRSKATSNPGAAAVTPDDSLDEVGVQTALAIANFEPVAAPGFHEVGLKRLNGGAETVLFSAGLSRDESQLIRIEKDSAQNGVFGKGFEWLTPETVSENRVQGASAEFWPKVVWLILGVLGLEQFLAWWFARRRNLPVTGAAR